MIRTHLKYQHIVTMLIFVTSCTVHENQQRKYYEKQGESAIAIVESACAKVNKDLLEARLTESSCLVETQAEECHINLVPHTTGQESDTWTVICSPENKPLEQQIHEFLENQ